MTHRGSSPLWIAAAAGAAAAWMAACTLPTGGTMAGTAGGGQSPGPGGTGGDPGPGGTGGNAGPGGMGGGGGGMGGAGGSGAGTSCGAPWSLDVASAYARGQAVGLAIDAMGSVFLASGFDGTTDLAGMTLNGGSNGQGDVLVAKLDQGGTPLWARRFGSSDANDPDYATGLAPGANGRLLLTGVFDTSVALGPGGGSITLPDGTNSFFAALDASGDPVWGWGLEDMVTRGVAAAGEEAFFAGYAADNVTLPVLLVTLDDNGGDDVFVVKVDSAGTPLWGRLYGDGSRQRAAGVATDSAGNALVAGEVSGFADFGGFSVNTNNVDPFVVKLDPNGNIPWAKGFGGEGDAMARAVAVDAQDNVIVAGDFKGVMDVGGTTLTASGSNFDIFLAKLDPSGNTLWALRFGDGEEQEARAVHVDAQGRIYLTGQFRGTLNFGGSYSFTTTSTRENVYVAAFEPDGTVLHALGFPNTSEDHAGGAVAADGCGNFVFAGTFQGELALGGDLPLSSTQDRLFVAKLPVEGLPLMP